ncbi:MAG: site-specific recombinase [Alcanivoracaceae bacterium]|nr:site-specific recombinase [Alcanivoracaceae bacterium]
MSLLRRRHATVMDLLNRLQQWESITALSVLQEIVAWLRPANANADTAGKEAASRMNDLSAALETKPEFRAQLSECLRSWLTDANFFPAFAALGILPRQGFRSELSRRLYEQLNPAPKDPADLASMLSLIFTRQDDADWVNAVPNEAWLSLFVTLWHTPDGEMRPFMVRAIDELLYALEMLSIWVAAEELEPDLVRLEPRMQERESAFVGLQRELSSFVRDYEAWMGGDESRWHDAAHARVMLDQCAKEIAWFRKRSVSHGTSISLTYLLERLEQTLARIEAILDIVNLSDFQRSRDTSLVLFRELITATTQRNSVRALWRQNLRVLSRTVTENASDHGEHYVTRDRSEYLVMLRSAAGAGLIIPLMAWMKIDTQAARLDAGTETLLICLIYGFGFVLIHMFGFTIATKQPAMTAARFASAVEKEGRGGANPKLLAKLLVQVTRSQFIAIIGNVTVALSLALLITWGWQHWQGEALLSIEQQHYQQHALLPFASLALLHAGIAGIWLFLSGLIAGYFDNRAAYLSVAERFKHHPLARRLLPQRWRENIGTYLAEHNGAIAGNFLFGVMLGATGYLGLLTGLPLDIRHVAFSSANLGFAGVTEPVLFATLLGYVLLIGLVNLAVSFVLALFVALRSRGVRISSNGKLLRSLWQEIREQPSALIWPPKDADKKTEAS